MHHWQPVFKVFSQSVMFFDACLEQTVAIRIRSLASSLLNSPQPSSWDPLVIVSMMNKVFRELIVTSHNSFLICACIRYRWNIQLLAHKFELFILLSSSCVLFEIYLQLKFLNGGNKKKGGGIFEREFLTKGSLRGWEIFGIKFVASSEWRKD